MMASQACKSVSSCQRTAVSWPSTGPRMCRQSRSLQVPGNTTMPHFIPASTLPFYPLFAIVPDLLFEDRHGSLESVYGVSTGLEGFSTMCAGHDNHHAALAYLQTSDPMRYHHMVGGPPSLHLGGYGSHLLFGHLWIRVVL